ncbi:hypothetical protein K439DRAFT_1630994 [Ramaria rubella]|nr:hypothetical protein K439DRAFT_1630994 [Ramaria rubella]
MRPVTPRHVSLFVFLAGIGTILLFSQRIASTSFLSHLHTSYSDADSLSQLYSEQDASAYRQRLASIRPLDTVPHSKTLGVAGRIYVVSLASRTDRRQDMSIIEQAMDLEFTWHDATDSHSSDVSDIIERIRWWRNEHRVNDSVPKADPSPFIFKWADDIAMSGADLGRAGADLWPGSAVDSALPPLPPIPTPDTRPPTLDAYGEIGDNFGTQALRPAQISCWHSHYQVLRRIAEGEDEVAIVLEDDVDMEWDLERRLRRMWGALPEDWDVVMLGHCHSQEWTKPALKGTTTLHPATHTLCTHAYAVNRRSAQHIVRRLRSEPFAYSRTIDHAMQHLSMYHHVKVFSVYPPVVIQTYESESDITPGRSKERGEWVEDSVRERIAMAEAEAVGGVRRD